jgi:hypothetical protein
MPCNLRVHSITGTTVSLDGTAAAAVSVVPELSGTTMRVIWCYLVVVLIPLFLPVDYHR